MASSEDRILVDTHCHLQDDRIGDRLSLLIAEASAAGVRAFVCCGSAEEDWKRVLDISLEYGTVIPFFGLHPFYVSDRGPRWERMLGDVLSACPHAGLGEVGLDGMDMRHTLDEQEKVLIAQLRLARELKRPLSLHCRKAWGRMLVILKKEGGLPHGGAFHAWSGAPDLVREVERLGAHIGFAASLTRTANRKVRESALAVSPDRMLIETDAPDIPPQGVPEGINRPAWLRQTFTVLARILDIPEPLLAERLLKNTRDYLFWLPKVPF